jgi:hypothetical protein
MRSAGGCIHSRMYALVTAVVVQQGCPQHENLNRGGGTPPVYHMLLQEPRIKLQLHGPSESTLQPFPPSYALGLQDGVIHPVCALLETA